MHGAGGRLRTQQVGRAHLNSGGAQRDRGRYSFRIHNAASSDYGNPHSSQDLRQQRKSASLFGQIVGQKNSAMPAGFKTLGNDGVGTVRFKPSRLVDGR